jgi:hypothetical protein
MVPISKADEYYLDDLERVRPVHQMGWVREPWQNASSFDEAMEGVTALAMSDVFPDEDLEVGPEELSDLQAKRYLDVADGFYLATGVDGGFGVFRFMWQNGIFFSMRPDFVFQSVVSHLGERPINKLESAIRDRLIDYCRELDALKHALAKGEIEAGGFYPMEWWIEFWRVRGISIAIRAPEAADASTGIDKPLKTTERYTLLTIIAALCDYSDIDPKGRGAAVQIAKMTEEIGAKVTDETIRKVLEKIPDALEARMK